MALWDTGNIDARLPAILVLEPKSLSRDETDRMVRSADFPQLADWLKHRKRAIAIGERLGIYRDFPVSKGCTSPFAPIWINEMVRRQG